MIWGLIVLRILTTSKKFAAILQLGATYKAEVAFATIFTAIFVVGYSLASNSLDLDVRKALIYLWASAPIWMVIFLGLVFLRQKSIHPPRTTTPLLFATLSDRQFWFVSSMLIFLCYLPIIALCFSVLTVDSWSSVRQAVGIEPLDSAHPVIFTVFVSMFVHLGTLVGNFEVGLLLFSLVQSAILATIFAYVLTSMRRERYGKQVIIPTFIFYAILPINAFAGMIMWKEVLFAGFGLVFLILLRRLFVEKAHFVTPKNIFYLSLFGFLFSAWRNNGIYVYVMALVLIFVLRSRSLMKESRYLLVLLLPLMVYVVYAMICSLIAKPANQVETMNVPLQQIARTVKYHGDSISPEDKAIIDEVFPYDKLGDLYSPDISDRVKGNFRLRIFNSNRERYIHTWFKLFLEHKKTYIASFLYGTYGYVYPLRTSSTSTDTIINNTDQINALPTYSDGPHTSRYKAALIKYRDIVSAPLPIIHNIGLFSCLLLLGAYIAIIRRRGELLPIFIVLACLFFTTILGPVNGEFRYLYLFVIAVPFVLVSAYAATPIRKKHGLEH